VTQTASLARAGAIVSAAFFAARLLGWIRTFVMTSMFGATPDLDAFFAAFRIPDLVYQVVAAGALASAMVPVVASLLATDQSARAWRVVTTVSNVLFAALVVLTLLFGVLAPVIVPLITPGFPADRWDLTIQLTRIMLLSPVFLALGAVATSLLNAEDRFAATAVAPIVYNVAIILGALLLGPFLGVTGLAIGVVAGSMGHLFVQLPAIRRYTTYRWSPSLHTDDPEVRTVVTLLVPRALGLAAVQVTFIVNTSLASSLGAGAITAYQVAFTILQLPLGLVAVPLGVVLLPTMSRAVAAGAHADYGILVDRSVHLLGYVMMLATALMLVLRREIVELLFGYGRFDAAAVDQTADALAVFVLGLTAHALIAVLARAFYAGQDTRTPVAAAVLAVAVNVVVSVTTVGTLGIAGLALGIAVGAWIETLVLLWRLEHRVADLSFGRELRTLGLYAFGASIAGSAAWLAVTASTAVVGTAPGKVLTAVIVVIASLAGGLAYLAWSMVLRLREPERLVRVVRRMVARGEA